MIQVCVCFITSWNTNESLPAKEVPMDIYPLRSLVCSWTNPISRRLFIGIFMFQLLYLSCKGSALLNRDGHKLGKCGLVCICGESNLHTMDCQKLFGTQWTGLVCDIEYTYSMLETLNPHGISRWLYSTCPSSLVKIRLMGSKLQIPKEGTPSSIFPMEGKAHQK